MKASEPEDSREFRGLDLIVISSVRFGRAQVDLDKVRGGQVSRKQGFGRGICEL